MSHANNRFNLYGAEYLVSLIQIASFGRSDETARVSVPVFVISGDDKLYVIVLW